MTKNALAFLGSMLIAVSALGADAVKFRVDAQSIKTDPSGSVTDLKGHARATFPVGAQLKMSAASMKANEVSGVTTLAGSARIEFQGGEIQAESLIVSTRTDGMREVTSESMRIRTSL